MLFFQSALLVGYGYTHVVKRWRLSVSAAILHGGIVLGPLAVLPLDLAGARFADHGDPIVWLIQVMMASVGLPFVALATTAPLLQHWFAASRHPAAGDPYFLYASSNVGSVAALLAYPTLIEPRISLVTQTRLWMAGYVVSAVLILVCLIVVRARAADPFPRAGAPEAVPPPSILRRVEWLALAFVPCSLLLAVTTFLTTDLAAVPLLWIVPLSIYLVTFIIAFSTAAPRAMSVSARVLPLVLLPLILLVIARAGVSLWFALPLHLLTFASFSMLCLGRLAETRPHHAYLTEFYLWLAAGGMLAGVFNSVVAPLIFTSVAEYPVTIAAACLLLAARPRALEVLRSFRPLARPAAVGILTLGLLVTTRTVGLEPREIMVLLGAPALVCFSLSRSPMRFAAGVSAMLAAGAVAGTAAWGNVLHAERTFFGVYRVSEDPDRMFVTLYHGTTVHGRQQARSSVAEPLTYYHRGSPIADVLRSTEREGRSIGIVGLGVGSLAAYARAGEHWTFYEIDRAVERIARDARFFRFLSACPECVVRIGDARMTLEKSSTMHDLLVLDAFSSDAIPVHLLTKEAFATYAARLTPTGLVVFHISNRHVELRPVLARLARDLEWLSLARVNVVGADEKRGHSTSDWVVMGREPGHFSGLNNVREWTALQADEEAAWSDDFANLLGALRWR